MGSFQVLAVTPSGLPNPSVAVAASRAGGLGVLDLEYTGDIAGARAAIANLTRCATRPVGLKLGGDHEILESVVAFLPQVVNVVVLTPADPHILRELVRRLRDGSRTVLLEIHALEQAPLGEEMGVTGLIAKGNEAGGWVGEETTFILLQGLLARTRLPVWAHGGIGLHSAAGCFAAGAAGVVLDAQLALTRESPLPEIVKAHIARMDGSETSALGTELGAICRLYVRPNLPVLEDLRNELTALEQDPRPLVEKQVAWRRAVRERLGWEAPERSLWLFGQDAAFAAPLAQRYRTVAGVLDAIRKAVRDHVRLAQSLKPLREGAPLAEANHTRYPILQGPMTRVSDTVAFAARVAEGGALPFLALALLRGPEVRALLEETSRTLGDKPWGVGILGFVPLELREEQIAALQAFQPPFALIAGGRPDQALSLEQHGIPTYLHVPSPGLLRMFLEQGARRFVFEGRECGGHVGPRSSFVLWDTMFDVLLEALPPGQRGDEYHIVFAGGIHDALSASMVATMAAPLAERGIRLGVLLGTAYLFAEEIVTAGAIVKGFQEQALRCATTVLLESGPGHLTRCAPSPYVEAFQAERRRLLNEGRSPQGIREALEDLNVGRLRMASKGITRHPEYGRDPQAPKFIALGEEEQHGQGMYMIGQVAALRDRVCTIEELHHDVSVAGSDRLATLAEPESAPGFAGPEHKSSDIAIIGMACLLPKARDLQTYWENILNKVNAVTEVPRDRWDWRVYFDEDPKARDKVYSRWGGFLEEIPFDPMRYGMPPSSLPSIEPLQLLTLEVTRAALQDAGYLDRSFPRDRASVILGVGGGLSDLGQQYAFRSAVPQFVGEVPPEVWSRLPDWTEDSFAGILFNVVAGRVANRFDLGGVNYTVDAACASSLAAVQLAVRELEAGTSDVVITGGADTIQSPFAYLCFSKTHALSPRGACRTFDESADGIAISEGIAILVLKRLADAERDGDRIYAVIKAVGGSSDGRAKGLTAPHPEGQALALERAYAKAGFAPGTVGLIEAHGTGTVAGDQAEVETLKRVFDAPGAERQRCALGSVKSMIGHTKCAAGVAGLLKVALALHHRTLPPTINVERPNPKAGFPESPFYVNTEPRPWVGVDTHPRRAGVSAFGFGGTNFHAVLEEYTGDLLDSARRAGFQVWPSELFVWWGRSREELLAAIEPLERTLARGARPALRDLAYTAWELAKERAASDRRSELKLALVATSVGDLRQKLGRAREALGAPESLRLRDPRGIYFTEAPLARTGKVAFLFPGQGSQHPDMLRDLAIAFPEVRERFEVANRVLAGRFPDPLSSYVYPPPPFSREEEQAQQQALTQTNVAQPALGAADLGVARLLEALGIHPDMAAGHSYGEYVALCVAGVFGEEALYGLSEARGRCMIEASGSDLGTMAAVEAPPGTLADMLRSVEGVWVANVNAPRQTIISGTRPGIQEAVRRLEAAGVRARAVPVACAFHSPLVAPARARFAEFLSTMRFSAPQIEVFSNTLATVYPADSTAIAGLLAEHLVRPVDFAREIEAMHGAGARIFVEVGPRNVLTGLVEQILGERTYVAVALDTPGRPGLLQLHHALGQLVAEGLFANLDRLYQGRAVRRLDLAAVAREAGEEPLPPTTWLVNGGRARPIRDAAAAVPSPISTGLTAPTRTGEEATRPPGPGAKARPAPASPRAAEGEPASRENPASVVPARLVRSGSPAPVAMHRSGPIGETHRVMARFQQLMNRFLDTQQDVLLAYLQAPDDGAAVVGERRIELPASQPSSMGSFPALEPPPAEAGVGSADSGAPGPPEVPRGAPPPEPSSRAASTVMPPASVSTDPGQLTTILLQIVSERTGYPPELLDVDLNVEADLGIDSIKRVEILGALQRACFPAESQRSQLPMEPLTKAKTLRSIVDLVSRALQQHPIEPPPAEGPRPPGPAAQDGGDGSPEVPRFLLTAADAPSRWEVAGEATAVEADGVWVVTDEGRGVARCLAEELREHGQRVALVGLAEEVAEIARGTYTANLTDPDAVTRLVELVRQQQGPVGAVLHLLPLMDSANFAEMDLAGWRNRLRRDVKSLYYVARAVASDFRSSGGSRALWLVGTTALGGAFGTDGLAATAIPSHGGIAGLIKTVALEWPHVTCKVVDLDASDSPATLAERLLQELARRDREVQVGYRGWRRVVVRARPAGFPQDAPPHLDIDSSWVVLVTGGARGITAEVACELAERYRPTLLLVGRSPLPPREEPAETAGLQSPRELKAALMEKVRLTGQQVTPGHVEAAYARLQQDREMRANLARMERTGATVRYHQVDVRDEAAFRRFIDEAYGAYDRLDGVIHAAGVIEDKLIEDKLPDSFDRVFDTKVDSALVLARALRPESLRFLVFFSSVAGCFGNRGQADYAAANEVLNKLALYLDKQWPGRVASINWGPWAKTGMVSAELARQFAARGVTLIPPSAARRMLDRELRHGRKGEVEVVVGTFVTEGSLSGHS